MSGGLSSEQATESKPSNCVVRASDLCVGYGRLPVLSKVSLEVRQGESWFVIGPNGQGKTTLLRAIMGRLRPREGRIGLVGDFARPDRLGFVPQVASFHPTLPTTVREFVLLGIVGLGVGRSGEVARLVWALERVGLAGFEQHNYWSLSEGQRQRALVARALIRRPSLLIADEPTSGLDMYVEAALLETLAQLNRSEELTLILVVHDLALAAQYATHVALVHDGCVEAGPAAEILRSERLTRAYRVPVDVRRDSDGFVNVRIGLAVTSK